MGEGTPPARMTKQRLAVVGELRKVGGAVRSREGRAVAVLHERLGSGTSLKALTNQLSAMEDHGLIEREIRGKRTFAIRLSGDSPIPTTDAPMGEVVAREDGEPRPAIAVPGPDPRPPLEEEGMGPREGMDYRLLADALLTRVAEVLDTTTDLATIQHRLATALGSSEKFRRQVADIGDELRAVKAERDGLRARLRQAESNIQTMLDKRNAVGMSDHHRRTLDRFMQAKPTGR